MHNRLIEHMHTNNILILEQLGFNKDITTKNAAFKLKSIDQKMKVREIFCDILNCVNRLCIWTV
jgi:hypothetical protein